MPKLPHPCRYDESAILDSSGKPSFQTMGQIKRATVKYYNDPQDWKAKETLNGYRRFRLNCFQTSLDYLNVVSLPPNALVSARLKRLQSIRRKLSRGQVCPVNELDDIIGIRVVCQSYSDALELGKSISGKIPAKIKDYIDKEHPMGLHYRAIHAITRFKQPLRDTEVTVRFEIQIRSWYQHQWACWCESLGEGYKEGSPNASSEKKATLRRCALEVEAWEKSNPTREQQTLPSYNGRSIAIAWIMDGNKYGFEKYLDTEIAKATESLERIDRLVDSEPVLLIGTTTVSNDGLKSLLSLTHPQFISSKSLDPTYWMPQ